VLDQDRLIGIISKSDFYRISYAISFDWTGKESVDERAHVFTAKDIMTRYPMQLHPDDTIGLAADIFLSNRFHALPVVDGESLVGIVTSHDLIALAFGDPVPEDNLIEDFSDI
jgi:CBS domain-containing protein